MEWWYLEEGARGESLVISRHLRGWGDRGVAGSAGKKGFPRLAYFPWGGGDGGSISEREFDGREHFLNLIDLVVAFSMMEVMAVV